MKRDDYRREFAAFQAARAGARQDGWRRFSPYEPLPARLQDRFSDLWSQSVVEALRDACAADESRPETERRGGEVLRAFAESWFIRAQCREIETELHRALTAPLIVWQGRRHAAVALADQAAGDDDPARRRALESKLAAHYAGLVDLREQRREVSAAAVQQLGYENPAAYAAAQFHRLTGEDLAAWAAVCERFLAETDTAYRRAVAEATAPADDPFDGRRMRRTAESLLRGFGVRPWQQTNVTVTWQASGPAGVFRVRVPEDIRWTTTTASGWRAWQRFLGDLACVQQAAWTSKNLPVELRAYGDPATAETWRWLFAGLLMDHRWTVRTLDIQPPPAIQRAMTAARWQRLRRAALRNVVWYGRETQGWTLERLRVEFAQHLDLTLSDWELLDELDAAMPAAAQLRGDWLAAALNDWLRTRYGDWYAGRRAGDDLIDLWNTGFRYPAGELAALVGVGPITPEALLAELNPSRGRLR